MSTWLSFWVWFIKPNTLAYYCLFLWWCLTICLYFLCVSLCVSFSIFWLYVCMSLHLYVCLCLCVSVISLLSNFFQSQLQYWPAQPDDPWGIRVASAIEFSVCLYVLSMFSLCFAPGVNLNRHDTSSQTIMNMLTIFHWEWT